MGDGAQTVRAGGPAPAILLVEHDVPMVERLATRHLRARLRPCSSRRAPPPRCSTTPRCAPPTWAGGVTVTATDRSPSPDGPSDDAAAPRRRRRRLRAVPGAVRRVASRSAPGTGGRAGRPERRRQDHRGPGRLAGSSRPPPGGSLLDGEDVTGEPAFDPGPAGHRPRARGPIGVRHAHASRRTCVLSFRAGVRPQRQPKAALDKAYELFPRLGERRNQHGRHRCRAASSGCSPSPASSSPSRACSSPTSCRSAWPRSSPNEVYRVLEPGPRRRHARCSIVEQHLDHALGIADEVVALDTRSTTRFQRPPRPSSATGPAASCPAEHGDPRDHQRRPTARRPVPTTAGRR